ncbi:hypothetical protein H632_c2748p1 [Helicosporidium sp. ATCC 50920]|nr:hypothetical protein H632_c2748p1 [Helicosporidium sp. ATCC 50920]|eukprot:KDD72909.1 hypothetical protein H632_c2748p1 [Helicosporidium sp. ATCC 50920]
MVRKQHNSGFKHKANVKAYYALFEGAMQQIQIEEQIRARMMNRAFPPPMGPPFAGGPPPMSRPGMGPPPFGGPPPPMGGGMPPFGGVPMIPPGQAPPSGQEPPPVEAAPAAAPEQAA